MSVCEWKEMTGVGLLSAEQPCCSMETGAMALQREASAQPVATVICPPIEMPVTYTWSLFTPAMASTVSAAWFKNGTSVAGDQELLMPWGVIAMALSFCGA